MSHVMHLIEPNHWKCPDCGREILLNFSPYSRTVLIPGDEDATHTGGTGGLVVSAGVNNDDPYLQPFEDWAREHLP